MKLCDEIQQKLEQLEFKQQLSSAEDLAHLESCQQCLDYQTMCEEFNSTLCELNAHDAEDSLVDSTLSSILALQEERKTPPTVLNMQWANALAASFMLISLISLFPYNSLSSFGLFSEVRDARSVKQLNSQNPKEKYYIKEDYVEHKVDFIDLDEEELSTARRKYRKNNSAPLLPSIKPPSLKEEIQSIRKQAVGSMEAIHMEENLQSTQEKLAVELTESFKRGLRKEVKSFKQEAEECCEESDDFDKVMLDRVVITGSHMRVVDLPAASPAIESEKDGGLGKIKARKAAKRKVKELSQDSKPVASNVDASLYFNEIQSLDGLTFQNANGYWANSYLPGDSKMRLLRANLEQNKSLDIHNSISQNLQPFDAPENAALAVYLSSDRAFINPLKPTRMHLQVGIQAANRKGGHRSALNMGLVFDFNKADIHYLNKMETLLMALLNSKQTGDSISLTIAGAPSEVLIEPQDFRHGTIQVTLQNLKAALEKKNHGNKNKDANVSKKEQLTLKEAIASTYMSLQEKDDPSKNLGSSMIVLFAANVIEDLAEIETTVHNKALKGMTLSTVSMNPNSRESLKQLALAGQGHARIMQSENDAQRVIEAELLASSKAVARALRLRIRLAKGVKLISVLGSYNLNEKQSQRVRDAEKSLDLRLSKNLGIRTDRGEDEEGIQIVIPSFYAGDTHVILLDVVVENPGALADVSLRYKDLLFLRNSLTQKQVNVETSPKPIGQIERNVIKNVLAYHFSESIEQASSLLRNNKTESAKKTLSSLQDLYKSMRMKFPIWNKDIEILKDETLLQDYIDLFNSNAMADGKKMNYIADSMQYNSWLKNSTKAE